MENLIGTFKSVSELVDDFECGQVAIPEIQRDVVWKADKIKALIDSIGNGFPCGSLILWEPRETDKALVRSMIRPERLDQFDGALPRYFLLDGQQRVTALASVTLKRDLFRSLISEVEDEMPLMLANLKRFPREIEATTDLAGYSFPWVLFNDLFAGTVQSSPQYATLPPDKAEGIKRYIQRLRDYKFPVQIIRDQNYSTVGEIFTRVNSQGTQLTGAEIYLARIVPHWRGITREFRNYRRQLRQENYDLDLTFLIRAITVIECKVPQIKKLADRVANDHPSRNHLNKTWKLARTATDKLIRVLRRDLLLDRSKYFTSKNALVPLVYYIANARSSNSAAKLLQRFFLLSQISEHYGGAAETTLRRDFRTMTDPALTVRQGLDELVTSVDHEARQGFRGLKIRPDHVSGVPSKSVFVLLMYILIRKRQARDWGHAGSRLLDEIDPKDMQLHHIFPFNFMVNNKPALKVYTDKGQSPADFRADVNDIANLTFLSQAKNGEIHDDPPWEYLPRQTTKETRKAHFVPEDPDLWKPERFSDFLEERRRLLAKAMTRLLKKLS
jgi:hypothetical protein